MQCVLIGNYGVGNFGDEALKQYFVESYTDIDWLVLSANPKEGEYARLPFGIRSFFLFSWIATLKCIYTCDAIVFGGGSLFTDAESKKAPMLWGWHALWAKIFRKKIILAFQGIGPLHSMTAQLITKWVCCKSSYISVRDQLSFNRLKSWSLNTKIVQSFDPVICLYKKKKVDLSIKNVLIVIPRNNTNASIHKLVEKHTGTIEKIRVLSFQPQAQKEREVYEYFSKKYQHCDYEVIESIDDLVHGLSSASFVLSERFHGTLAALAYGIPYEVVIQATGDKHSVLQSLSSTSIDSLSKQVEEASESLRSALICV